MGPHHQKKKGGSNSNSSRTSPSRLEDSEFVKNSLLASQNGDFGEEGKGLMILPLPFFSCLKSLVTLFIAHCIY